MQQDVHPVDQFLPVPKLLTLGFQHVLVMYAGAVAVPLILGRALKMSPEDVSFLISADLFAAIRSCQRRQKARAAFCGERCRCAGVAVGDSPSACTYP